MVRSRRQRQAVQRSPSPLSTISWTTLDVNAGPPSFVTDRPGNKPRAFRRRCRIRWMFRNLALWLAGRFRDSRLHTGKPAAERAHEALTAGALVLLAMAVLSAHAAPDVTSSGDQTPAPIRHPRRPPRGCRSGLRPCPVLRQSRSRQRPRPIQPTGRLTSRPHGAVRPIPCGCRVLKQSVQTAMMALPTHLLACGRTCPSRGDLAWLAVRLCTIAGRLRSAAPEQHLHAVDPAMALH